MRIRLLVFSACMILLSGIAFGQTVISESYFPLAADGGGYTTRVTISRTGNENRTVKIEFLYDSGTALPITLNVETGTSQNCGSGCFTFTLGPSGYDSILAVTPNVESSVRLGYAKVTVLSPDSSTTGGESVTLAMAITFAGSITDEPFLRNPSMSFANPFTDSAYSANGIIVINPQTTTA
jgi:hypothetical protein